MKFFIKSLQVFLFVILTNQVSISQTCPTSSISAGSNTTICNGKCATLTATVVALKTTSSYSVAATAYTPFSYSNGTVAIPNVDDVWSPAINIGFPFCYFGNTFNQLLIGSNGEITFNVAAANGAENWAINSVLPNLTDHRPNTICGPYRDIDPSIGIGSTVTYTTYGLAPCRVFVASWNTVPMFGCNTSTSTFQIALYEKSNIIDVYIQNSTACLAWRNGQGLIGIQNGLGTTAVAPPGRNVLTPWTAINEAWRFAPTGAPTFTVNWTGPSGFAATGLTAAPCPTATSNYTATMIEARCGAAASVYTSVVQVSVTPSPTIIATASPTSICRGSSSTLSATGALTYTWMPGVISGSATVVSPTATTVYTVTGTNAAGCTSTKTINLIVTPSPSLTAVSNPTSICAGNSATLTSAGAATYTWSPGALTGANVVVTPSVTTTYTVTGSNLAGCTNTRTVILTVSSLTVNATANPTVICNGGSSTLTANGATTYTWNPGAITGGNAIVSPISTTIYTVTGKTGLCSNTKTVSVTVSTSPTITASSAPVLVCFGNTATLSAVGATTYTWNPGSLSGASVVITPTVSSSIYTVTGTNASGCSSTTTLAVNAKNNPTITVTASPTVICIGNSSILTANGGLSYTWTPSASNGNTVSVTPIANTVYTVTGSNGSGCVGSSTVNVTVSNPIINAVSNPTVLCVGATATLTGSGASTYTWNPGGLSGTTIAVTPSISTIYTVTGTTTLGCVASKTLNLVVNPNPTVTAVSNPTVICAGSSATLTASGATTYTWNPGNLIGTNVVVTPASTTIYTVTGKTGNCINTNTVTLTVNALPILTAVSNPTTLCIGNTATLTSSGANTYTWNPGNLTGASIAVTPSLNTTYTVTGTNAAGCINTRTVSLTVSNPIINAVSNPTALCVGATATLTGSGASTYTWNPGALSGTSIAVTPSITTIYTVTGTTTLGCVASKTLNLIVNSNPTVTAVSNPTVICAGTSATLTGSGATTYTWSPGALVGTNVVVTPASTTIYTVIGKTGTCSNTNTISLTVNSSPTITASTSPTLICNGTSATLTAGGALTYTWNPGVLTGSTTVVSPTITTTYTVTGSNGFCTNTKTVTLLVSPIPTLTAVSNPTAICVGASATLTTSGASTYTWNPGALTGANITVTPAATTIYSVVGTSAAGCTSATRTVNLIVNPNPTVTAVSNPTVICAGSSATLTGNGATSYTWNPGALTGTNAIVNPITTTVYTVTGTNGSCTNTKTVSVTVNPLPTVTAVSNPTILCSGNTATLTGSGASTYIWNPGALAGSTVSVTPNTTTIYTVEGTSTLGCINTRTLSLTVTTTPTVTASATSATICVGASTSLTASGATTYTWNPGALAGATITVIPTTSTIYTVTGANGSCINTRTVSITVNSNPTVTAVSNPTAICAGSSATLTGSGASTYIWNPGALSGTSVVVTPSITTNYTVVGTSGLGCTNSRTVTVQVNSIPTITATSNPTSICAGSSATLTGIGAATYTWNPGVLTGSTIVVTPSATTVYSVVGTSAAGCASLTRTVNLTVSPIPTVTAISSPTVICAGSSATLTGSGATTYTWNPGVLVGTTAIVTPSATTIYTVIGRTGICSNTSTVSLTVNALPTLTALSNPTAICAGSSATLTGNGASTYTWNPGAIAGNTVVVTPSATTVYTVSGSSIAGCTNTKTLSLTVNSIPTITVGAASNSICAGNTATIGAIGATSFTWNPGNLTTTFTVAVNPSASTIYTATGSNINGCTDTKTLAITVVANPTITASASPTIICSGNLSTLTASGSTNYTWTPGISTGTNVTVTPTVTTTYTVTSDNGLGCVNTETVMVTVNSNPTLTLSASSNTICSGNTGTLTATGATSYTWSPGAITTASIVVTPSATTVYTVTGDNGTCSTTQTITLAVSPNLTVTASASSSAICSGSSATLTGSGATSYTWNPGALTGSTTVVSPTTTTTYTVDGDNGLGCVANNTITIAVNSSPSLSITASSTSLCAVGSVTLTANGGTTYTWSPVTATTASIVDNPTVTTTYTVTSDNGIGCIGTETITINVGTNPTLTVSASNNTICLGNSTTLSANGASTYTWNPGTLTGATVAVTPTINTTYTVTGDNGIGCTSTQTIDVTVGAALSVTATASSNTICAGSNATLTGSGATSYTWNPGAITGATTVITPTSTTTYTVDADNGTGCVASETISINVNSIPTISISTTSTALCSSGSVTLTASGASTYTWNPTAALTSTIVDTPIVSTTYTVTGADLAGCSSTETITINVGTTPTVSVISSATTICVGATATLTGNGATTYTWNPGALTGTTAVVSPTATTTYTVDGDNGAGCVASNTITISVNSTPSLTVVATSTALCSAGSITLTASGGTTYTWSPLSAITASVVDSPTITTTYTVSSDNGGGCIGTQTITVNVGTSPSFTITASPVGTICVGTTATLTASGAASYTWNPTSATTNVITDAPSVTTTYTITGDNGFGCTATNTFVLNVAPGASITAIANPTAACANSTVSLSASGATTYTWMPMNVSGASVTASPSVSTTYTVLGDNGTCIASSTVIVNVTPGPANVTTSVSGEITCITSSVTLFGSTTTSPVVYLWTGPNSYTSTTQNPTNITQSGIYTLGVIDLLTGCVTTSTVTVVTNTVIPGLTATTSGSLGCAGTVTLTAASTTTNTLTYIWSGPSSFTSAVQSPTTNIAGNYTVNVADAITGCNTTTTVVVGTTTATANFTATVSGSLTCIGDVTLTATPSSTDAVTYSWTGPSSFTSTVQSPTTTVAGDYTISVTEVASGCSSTSTISVGTNTVGPNLTAITSGSLGCASSVTLTAATTETNTLTYAWSGPSSFTSAVQSPTTSVAGDYTVSISDAISGCSSTSIVTVGTNTDVPVVGVTTPGPVLGCNTTVTLSVITAPTITYSYSWSGPTSFTSTAQTPTASVAGDYAVSVTDPTNGCSNSVTVTVTTDTTVPVFSATVIPATCTGTVTNNDGTILIAENSGFGTYDLSQAASYTGTATFVTGNVIPMTGILTNTLNNPATATPYTIRVFSANGCFKDTTVLLLPTDCSSTTVNPNVLGMTKAVSTPTFVNNNAYNVTYTIVATNASTVDLTSFSIIDNLNSTFPLPTTYSVISTPVVTSQNSSLTVNAGYDGSVQNDMLLPLTSTLTAGRKDTIVFTVQINPNGFFGSFNNSAIGSGFDGAVTVADSSNTGFAWDPDNDGDPTNNDIPTVLNLTPNTQIGVAKSGTVSGILDDKTLDVTYVITVKNLGNDTLKSVQVFDTLKISTPATFTIKSGPTTTGNLSANGGYNGSSDIALLIANSSALAPGETQTITFVLNVTPNGLRKITNVAIGAGLGANGGIVRDSSNTGAEADPNGNGIATEQGENIPTVVELPDVNLFIPEVFTPDGDGKNDFFVIKGIEGRTVNITVFNRWGNKVYQNSAYDNTWNGTPNVSGLIIGSNKLPQGTYYYVVEFEDGVDDPINGYVVLQY